jgi:hypothetical protein
MRFLSLTFITATIAGAHQMLAAQTPPSVGVLAGHQMPTDEMQAIGKATLSADQYFGLPLRGHL